MGVSHFEIASMGCKECICDSFFCSFYFFIWNFAAKQTSVIPRLSILSLLLGIIFVYLYHSFLFDSCTSQTVNISSSIFSGVGVVWIMYLYLCLNAIQCSNGLLFWGIIHPFDKGLFIINSRCQIVVSSKNMAFYFNSSYCRLSFRCYSVQ